MARLLTNLLIVSVWVNVFNAFGLLTLRAQPHVLTDPTIGHIVDGAVIGLIICAVGEIGALAYSLFVIITLGVGCLLLPVYWIAVGYFKLWLASVLLPGWFTYTQNPLAVVFMSAILGASRLHPRGEMKITREGPPRDPREVAAQWREIPDK